MSTTLADSVLFIKNSLIPLYGEQETGQIIFIVFEHLLNYGKIDIHLYQKAIIPDETVKKLEDMVEQLKNFRPVQYIIGKTEFYGRSFQVNESVLIPRQETEELVQWIIGDHRDKKVTILDIGTGSGCIAVTLAAELPESRVFAGDISVQAIGVAQKNAELNRVPVLFYEFDIFHPEDNRAYDVMVSNPPYVRESEKVLMSRNVLDYEPGLALFVSDDDPLRYYRAIAEFGKTRLKAGGRLYFEINEHFGEQIAGLLLSMQYEKVEMRKDINGKDRMVKAEKTN